MPICRFFSAKVDAHFFTADPAECEAVIAKWPDAWTLETRAAFWIDGLHRGAIPGNGVAGLT